MAKFLTREQAIITLVDNDIFYESDINTSAMKFYIKNLMENTDNIYDIDRYAHLNTLFGYDIGFRNAMEIDYWLWNTDINTIADEYPLGLDTCELTYKDKELVQKAVEGRRLDVSFDKWRTTDFNVYEYFN